jgi:hypothetical protein
MDLIRRPRAARSHLHIPVWCKPDKGLTGMRVIVKIEVVTHPSDCLNQVLIGFQTYFFVFQTWPQPFNEDIMDAAALACCPY